MDTFNNVSHIRKHTRDDLNHSGSTYIPEFYDLHAFIYCKADLCLLQESQAYTQNDLLLSRFFGGN